MSTFNDLYMFLSTDDVKNNGKYVMELSAKALLGDLESLKELCELMLQAPAFYKNVMFTEKLKAVLRGVCRCEEDIIYLAETLANGNEQENTERILECIDSLDTMSKVAYVVNATRSYIRYQRGFRGLNKTEYYRCLHIIKNILIEDIEFLANKLHLKEVQDSDSCVALDNLGLMYITTSDESVSYAFSRLAYKFYEEVIAGDNEKLKKIPMPDNMPQKMDLGPKFVEL